MGIRPYKLVGGAEEEKAWKEGQRITGANNRPIPEAKYTQSPR